MGAKQGVAIVVLVSFTFHAFAQGNAPTQPTPGDAAAVPLSATNQQPVSQQVAAPASVAPLPSGVADGNRPGPGGPGGGSQKPDIAGDMKSGLLLKFGFGAGVAAVLDAPFRFSGWHPSNKVSGVVSSAMPYVAIFPGFWGLRNQNKREFCARTLSTTTSEETRKATAVVIAEDDGSPNRVVAQQIASDTPVDETIKGQVLENYESCWPTWVGLFVGVPSSFQVNTELGGVEGSRTVRPVVGFGPVYAPWPQLHIMAGLTYSVLQLDSTGTGKPPTADVHVWSTLFGVGCTLDVASLLMSGGGAKK